jgi:hypothetical protein
MSGPLLVDSISRRRSAREERGEHEREEDDALRYTAAARNG